MDSFTAVPCSYGERVRHVGARPADVSTASAGMSGAFVVMCGAGVLAHAVMTGHDGTGLSPFTSFPAAAGLPPRGAPV